MINVEEHIIIITITRNFQLVSGLITHPSYRSGARVTFASGFFKGMAAVLPCPRSLGNSVALIGSGLRPAEIVLMGGLPPAPQTPWSPERRVRFFWGDSLPSPHTPWLVFFIVGGFRSGLPSLSGVPRGTIITPFLSTFRPYLSMNQHFSSKKSYAFPCICHEK